jgi:peptidoglycan/LPS O-acetylase OafA/YrhL
MPWIIFICLGIIIGHYIYKERPTLPENLKDTTMMGLLEKTGKYSFEIYIVHWLVIYLIFCIVYPKFRKPYSLE